MSVGRKIGNWTFVRALGAGAFGSVYEVEHSQVRGLRAAIRMEANLPASYRLREAEALARVSHPNVVRMFDAGELDDGTSYVVFEYIEGETLAQLLHRRGTIPAERAAHIGGQVADALVAIHAAGIVHRDIKPNNIIIRPDHRAIVTDFGVSLHDRVQESEGAIAGTLPYMAPEAFIGRPSQPATDVYALGSTMYQALTGELPFTGGSVQDFMAQVHSHEPRDPRVLNAAIPQDLNELVRAMLAKSVDARPTPKEIATSLLRIAGGEYLGPKVRTQPRLITNQVIARPSEEDESGLFLNIWFPLHEGARPALPVKVKAELLVNLGPPLREDADALSSEAQTLLYASDYVDVVAYCAGADIEPPRVRVPLPPDQMRIARFELTPRQPGALMLEILLLIRGESVHHAHRDLEAYVDTQVAIAETTLTRLLPEADR